VYKATSSRITDTRALFRAAVAILLASLFYSVPTLAKEPHAPVKQQVKQQDIPEKIHIDADQMKLNITSGNSVYTGNVKVTQGDLVLTGDRVTLTQIDNTLQKFTVIGKPARYNHVTEDGQTIIAESDQMVYTASENRLVMTRNARLEQPDHLVSSQKIIYDTLNKIVMAGDVGDRDAVDGESSPNNQRVNITLTPKTKKDSKNQ
jgi:lipopolysaccharide export system protein LptA